MKTSYPWNVTFAQPLAIKGAGFDVSPMFFPTTDGSTSAIYDAGGMGTGTGPASIWTSANYADMFVDNCTTICGMSNNSMFYGNNPAAAVSITGVASEKYIIGPRYYSYEIQNFELHAVNVVIYWCKPRHDIVYNSNNLEANITAVKQAQETFEGQNVNDILAKCFYRDGIIGAPAAGCMMSLPISTSPYESTSFCQAFKIVKKSKFHLNPGKCHRITVKKKKIWIPTMYELSQSLHLIAWKKGLFPLFKLVSCPVNDTTNTKKVATGASSLSIIYSFRTKVWQVNAGVTHTTNLSLTAPAGVPVTGQSILCPNGAFVTEN